VVQGAARVLAFTLFTQLKDMIISPWENDMEAENRKLDCVTITITI
jgi:hypothetical protein